MVCGRAKICAVWLHIPFACLFASEFFGLHSSLILEDQTHSLQVADKTWDYISQTAKPKQIHIWAAVRKQKLPHQMEQEIPINSLSVGSHSVSMNRAIYAESLAISSFLCWLLLAKPCPMWTIRRKLMYAKFWDSNHLVAWHDGQSGVVVRVLDWKMEDPGSKPCRVTETGWVTLGHIRTFHIF